MPAMRDAFASWYPISEEERRAAYSNGLVVLDANVLLDLYRFDKSPRQEVLGLLHKVSDRLWLPHQVALEFHRNRLNVIHDAAQLHGRLRRDVDDAKNKLRNAFNTMRSRTGVGQSPEQLNEIFDLLDAQVNALTPEEPLSLKQAARSDPILDEVTALYSERVGEGFSPERQQEEAKTGQSRIEAQTPPGYLDVRNKEEALGDYFLWRQTLDEAKQRKQPVLLVTQENKEDWLNTQKGITIGPRRELVAEMLEEAGVRLHLVNLETFLEEASKYLKTPVSEQTLEQASQLGNITDAPSRQHGLEQEVAETLKERGWDFIRSIYSIRTDGRITRYDLGVPFLSGPEPDAETHVIALEVMDLPPGYSGQILERLARTAQGHVGLTVLVTYEPIVGTASSTRYQSGVYRCGWGEFPKFQAITLQDLQLGRFDLPVGGIQALMDAERRDSQGGEPQQPPEEG
jgi:hypothetical protein